MTALRPVRTFAVACDADAYFVHSDRKLAADGRGYTSQKHPQAFDTEADARAYAIEVLGAAEADIAPSAGER